MREDAHAEPATPPAADGSPKECSFANVPALTSALRRGDDAAFLWLHTQWSRRIERLCFVLSRGDETLTGEVAQAVWHRLARHIRVLPDEAALWNWIAQAARHAAADQQRKGGRYRRAMERFTEWWSQSPAAEPGDPDAAVASALEAALENLSPEERQLIQSRYFDREPLVQMGARLGLSERAVEGRLARLRQRLRDNLKTHLKSDNR